MNRVIHETMGIRITAQRLGMVMGYGEWGFHEGVKCNLETDWYGNGTGRKPMNHIQWCTARDGGKSKARTEPT